MKSHDTVEALFASEYSRVVRALSVAFDPESAADAVQDAFVAADLRWSAVKLYEDPGGWVRRVAINRLRTGRRNERRRGEILATIRVAPSADLTDSLLDLRQAIEELPRQMRLAVCLHYLAGLSVDQVADSLGVRPGTVKSNLFDARRALRATLEVRS